MGERPEEQISDIDTVRDAVASLTREGPVMDRITSRAHLTTVCQQAREQWDHVQAIVLFGSRAKGTARPDSDWDIAVIVDDPALTELRHNKVTPAPPPFDRYENLDVLTLTPAMIDADRLSYGRIAQQIAQDGTALMGEWEINGEEMKDKAVMDPEEWRRGINDSLTHMKYALNAIHDYKEKTRYIDCDTDCGQFIVQSQESAEHLVKTLMTRRKVLPRKTHDIDQLAQIMRDHPLADIPDSHWQVLTERVHSLNGATHDDHQAGYGTYTMTAKTFTHATERLVKTIRFVIDEIGSGIHPARYGVSMGLSIACWGTDVHQAALKQEAQGLLPQCHKLVETAVTVFGAPDTPKPDVSRSSPPVVLFLTYVAALERVCLDEVPKMLAQIADGTPLSNLFEINTTTLPSPFDKRW